MLIVGTINRQKPSELACLQIHLLQISLKQTLKQRKNKVQFQPLLGGAPSELLYRFNAFGKMSHMTKNTLNRRTFLQGLAASQLALALGWSKTSLAENGALKAQPITDGLSLITGAGGNVVVFKGSEGVTLIDSGIKEQAPQLLELVDQLGNKAPIQTLFNTHWHEEHTGGNAAVHKRGADIVAHENTKLWLSTDFEVHWRNRHHKPQPQAALPTTTFYSSGKKDLGGTVVEYHHLPRAHTDGDIYLHFPDSNVLVVGGLLSNGSYPICDIATGGWIGELIEANAALLKLADDKTILIPERGPAKSKADLQVQHDMLADLFEQMKELAREGYSGHNMLEANVTKKYDLVWGDPTEFVLETYRGMWAHTYDMGGFI